MHKICQGTKKYYLRIETHLKWEIKWNCKLWYMLRMYMETNYTHHEINSVLTAIHYFLHSPTRALLKHSPIHRSKLLPVNTLSVLQVQRYYYNFCFWLHLSSIWWHPETGCRTHRGCQGPSRLQHGHGLIVQHRYKPVMHP